MFSFGFGGPPKEEEVKIPDTAETVYISSLALLKMLKHGRAGVPVEVMGLMLGTFVDEYTINVVDVFAVPQNGTGTSVEAVDHEFQAEMLQMLKQTGRTENVVGWYHSHPGFGCWLSSVDIEMQKSFEQQDPRCVAVVVDPIQSVKGRVVIDAFKLIDPMAVMMGSKARQVTSVTGHLTKPTTKAIIQGLNKYYYSLRIGYRKEELDQKMLLSLGKPNWIDSLAVARCSEQTKANIETLENILKFVRVYEKRVAEEAAKDTVTTEKEKEEEDLKLIGRIDPKRVLTEETNTLMTNNILQVLGTMLDTIIF